jgi:hypothetical protein
MKKETVATGGALGGGALGTALVFATGCLGTKALVFLGISSGAEPANDFGTPWF